MISSMIPAIPTNPRSLTIRVVSWTICWAEERSFFPPYWGGNGKSGQSIGEGIGALAGGALGTLAGGAGTGIGAALGKAAGGAVEKLVRSQTVRPPKKSPAKRMRQPTKRERKLLADAERMSKRTGEPRYLQEAQLRVYRPAEYKRRRDAGTLWSQNAARTSTRAGRAAIATANENRHNRGFAPF